MVAFELEGGDGASLFSAKFAIPDGILSALQSVTTTLSLASPVPLIRVVLNTIASFLNFVTTEDGAVLCTEDGSPLIWP